VPIRVACQNGLRVEAASVVSANHSELTFLIIEFHYDLRRSRVSEGVRQRFSGNAKDFVHNVALESIASSFSFDREISCGMAIEISGHPLNQGLQLRIA
jgi:hypothetical protein